MAAPTYLFTPKPRPTEPGQENNFGNIQLDGSRRGLTGSPGNGMQTTDATGTPQKSPLAITTGTTTIQIPTNATTITLVGSAAMNISELSSMANYFTLPTGVVQTISVTNQLFLYVTTASTGTLSFYFEIV